MPGNLAILRKSLDDNVAMLDRLLSAEPELAEAKRDKAVNNTRIGEAWRRLGDLMRAEEYHRLSLDISSGPSAEFPDESVYLRDMAVSYANLGTLQLDQGRC